MRSQVSGQLCWISCEMGNEAENRSEADVPGGNFSKCER